MLRGNSSCLPACPLFPALQPLAPLEAGSREFYFWHLCLRGCPLVVPGSGLREMPRPEAGARYSLQPFSAFKTVQSVSQSPSRCAALGKSTERCLGFPADELQRSVRAPNLQTPPHYS